MNSYFHRSQSPGQHPPKPHKKRLAKEQLRLLETSFNANKKLKAELKLELAHQLGLPPRQVAIWYQNRRARNKTLSIEHEYKNIQQELGNVLAQNIRLEKEVSMLKHELNKAQQMLYFVSASSATTLPSLPASGDEHASLSSPGNINCSWGDASVFPEEKLYSCIIGSHGH